MFEKLLEIYRADPAYVFFADDLPANVASAASVGITAHLFTDCASPRAGIEAFAARQSASEPCQVGRR